MNCSLLIAPTPRKRRKVMADLGVLSVLAVNLPGPGTAELQLVVIHHNDCGMGCRPSHAEPNYIELRNLAQ